jgi:hypothetical protein
VRHIPVTVLMAVGVIVLVLGHAGSSDRSAREAYPFGVPLTA